MRLTTTGRAIFGLCFCFSLLTCCSGGAALGADYNHEVIYQVFTDRFFNGKSDNDDPKQSAGLFDSTRKNWHAYWGGDLAGVKAKLDYIKGLGATAVWISPVFDNVNLPGVDGSGKMTAPYHGYHTRDFMRVEEHFGDSANTFADFDDLVQAAHKRGLKIIVDIPFNHTSEYNHGEYGALFNAGQYRSDVENDRNKYFNHLPLISDWNDRFQLQYRTLAYLGDLNQENSYIDTYLKTAAAKLRNHGADGTRLDAAKHTNWAWQQTLANGIYSQGDHLILGEWWLNDINEPLYRDAVKWANQAGISLYDFNLANALREAFKPGGDLKRAADTVAAEDKDFRDSRGLITFIDNHDMPRFQSLNPDKTALHQALALLFTCRGIPSLYYGTEQYLHDDTAGGGDPYTRAWMPSFDQDSAGYKFVQTLTHLRSSSPAFSEGVQQSKFVSPDVWIFSRRAGDCIALVAVNKGKAASPVNALATGLADGHYDDALGQLSGAAIDVKSGLTSLSLPPQSVSVWCGKTPAGSDSQPWISSVRPPVVSGGTSVTLSGHGFGVQPGKVEVGGEIMDAASWADDKIVFAASQKNLGALPVTVVQGSAKSNSAVLGVVERRLIPVRFTVEKAPLANPGDQIFISGSASMLGQGKKTWEEAAGPMYYSDDDRRYILCVPLPAGKTVEFKMLILDKNGAVVKEESTSHTYQVPGEGCWKNDLVWQP